MAKMAKKIAERSGILLQRFGQSLISREDIVTLFREKYNDNENLVDQVLFEMKKADLLESLPDRKYRLKLLGNGNGITKDKLLSMLKKAADIIRTRVDYKFILVLLFLKRTSDRWQEEYENTKKQLLAKGAPEAFAEKEARSRVYHQFDYEPALLWENIRKDPAKLPENLSKALKVLAEKNKELRHLVASADFLNFTSNPENLELLRQLVELFSEEKLHTTSSDMLGDAYEWILRYFAPEKAKEGEVYTPREVIQLLFEIADPHPDGKEVSVYDPAAGSGGMLIVAGQYVKEKYGPEKLRKLSLYGQEANPATYSLGLMNVYMHDLTDAKLEIGDTLLYPKFLDGNDLKEFNIVVANPPWNQDGYPEEVLKKGDFVDKRFSGYPTKSSADWAWIQHMLASAKEKVAVVIDNGALFRGGAERVLRKTAIENGTLECVILLPDKLFYNTGAPGAVMIFNKRKERKGQVLFINAGAEFVKHPEVRRLNQLSQANIQRIASAYHGWTHDHGFSEPVSLERIRKNDYDLNVTRYVYREEEREEINVAKEWKELKELEAGLSSEEKKIEGYLREIK